MESIANTFSCIAECENACLIKEQAKRTPYTSIQALHGVAFHSEEDAAMYPHRRPLRVFQGGGETKPGGRCGRGMCPLPREARKLSVH